MIVAFIDVSEVISDTDFQDTITLIENIESINDCGETVLISTISRMNAVVQAGNGETLKRNPEHTVISDWITVYASYKFEANKQNLQWNGKNYIVKTVTDYKNWGTGYTRADCLLQGLN